MYAEYSHTQIGSNSTSPPPFVALLLSSVLLVALLHPKRTTSTLLSLPSSPSSPSSPFSPSLSFLSSFACRRLLLFAYRRHLASRRRHCCLLLVASRRTCYLSLVSCSHFWGSRRISSHLVVFSLLGVVTRAVFPLPASLTGQCVLSLNLVAEVQHVLPVWENLFFFICFSHVSKNFGVTVYTVCRLEPSSRP
jgi:hypothetical protein